MPANTIINLRRGSATAWSGVNPVLSSGEPGYDFTNKILKIGDGSTPWNSLSNHSHTSSNINDFANAVASIAPEEVVEYLTAAQFPLSGNTSLLYIATDDSRAYRWTGSQYVEIGPTAFVPLSSGNFSTLQVNGTDVSLSGHTHTASNINDFNSSVSGLLPVTNILGGSNITISQSGTNFTVAVTGSLGLTTEEVDDRVNNLLVAGSGINLNYNDSGNTLTITNTSISPDEIEEYTTYTNLPASGNINILYRTTDDARLYQWSGTVYAEIGPDSVTTGSHASQHYTNGIDPILNVVSRPATLTATVNNYDHNNADIIYLNADANRIITGLVAAADGSVKLLINSSLFTITLDHQDTNSNPENRFMVPFGSDYVLQPGYSITIVYDSNTLRWRILA